MYIGLYRIVEKKSEATTPQRGIDWGYGGVIEQKMEAIMEYRRSLPGVPGPLVNTRGYYGEC